VSAREGGARRHRRPAGDLPEARRIQAPDPDAVNDAWTHVITTRRNPDHFVPAQDADDERRRGSLPGGVTAPLAVTARATTDTQARQGAVGFQGVTVGIS
jgi:hypothetical protein